MRRLERRRGGRWRSRCERVGKEEIAVWKILRFLRRDGARNYLDKLCLRRIRIRRCSNAENGENTLRRRAMTLFRGHDHDLRTKSKSFI
jgi:hypothetical protein